MRGKIRNIFLSILNMKGNPKDIALAAALGIWIAFFPIIGTHTALAFGLAWLFRVSPAVTLGASFVNNPWTMAPLYGFGLYVGVLITRADITEAHIQWSRLNWSTFVELIKVIGIPFCIGNILLGTIFAVIAYFLVLKAVIRYRCSGKEIAGSDQK